MKCLSGVTKHTRAWEYRCLKMLRLWNSTDLVPQAPCKCCWETGRARKKSQVLRVAVSQVQALSSKVSCGVKQQMSSRWWERHLLVSWPQPQKVKEMKIFRKEVIYTLILSICSHIIDMIHELFCIYYMHCCCSVTVVFDSLWPHGLQHARLLCPSLSPRVCSDSCPLSRWCHPTISSSVIFFSFCP